MAWTQERVEIARQCKADGISASGTAEILGGITRNAVIGKWMRLGLCARRAPSDPRPRPQRLSGARSQGDSAISKNVNVAIKRQRHPEPLPDPDALVFLDPADIPRQQRRSLMRLGERHCRFPYGEPGGNDFFFCGAATEHLPYCAMHARIAFRGPVAVNPRPGLPSQTSKVLDQDFA